MSTKRIKNWSYPHNVESVEDVSEFLRRHHREHSEEATERLRDLSVFGTGNGDMLKTDYDANANGIADKAETVDDGAGNASTAVEVKDAVDKKHAQAHAASHSSGQADVVNHDNLAGFVAAEHKSLPNTIAQVLSDHNKALHEALGLAPVATPTFTGQVTAPTVDLTGGQIAFPAAQSASADVNTLDDYEEGTWTPDLRFGGLKVGITYTVVAGIYTKTGREVSVHGLIVLSSKGSSVGNAAVYGFPLTVLNTPGAVSSLSFSLKKVSFADTYHSYADPNATYFGLWEVSNAGVQTHLTGANFADDSTIIFSLVYTV